MLQVGGQRYKQKQELSGSQWYCIDVIAYVGMYGILFCRLQLLHLNFDYTNLGINENRYVFLAHITK